MVMLREDQEPIEPFCDDWEEYLNNPMPIQLRPREGYDSEPSEEDSEEAPSDGSGEEDELAEMDAKDQQEDEPIAGSLVDQGSVQSSPEAG